MAVKKSKEKVEKKKIDKADLEKAIIEMGKKEMTPSKIGLALQKEYGIKSEKKIQKILENAGIKAAVPEDLDSLIKKAALLKKHLQKNKMDGTAKRGLQITIAKINQKVKYLKKKRVLPKDWTFSI